MKKHNKFYRNRYITFVISLVAMIIIGLIVIQKSINIQKQNAFLINTFGKQYTLSQRIAKIAFSFENDIDDNSKISTINSLKTITNEFEKNHAFLCGFNKENGNIADSLLKVSEIHLNKIVTSSKNIINNPSSEDLEREVNTIARAESSFLLNMDAIIYEHQKHLEEDLQKLNYKLYFLAFLWVLLLLGMYFLVIAPSIKQLFIRNKELTEANEELSISKNDLEKNMLALKNLKIDLEKKEAHNKIFIEQAPTSIAMLDNNMCYIAVSKRWVSDYKMGGQDVVGRCHYELFPEIGDEWKNIHEKCLNGAIDICDEAPFIRKDGSVQWIYWDVRPWYISEGIIGGLIMHTGDITDQKETEEERIRIEKILERTNEIGRIGTWEINFVENSIFWSKMVYQIHEAPLDYEPDLNTAINFFKEGDSRDAIEKAVNEALENGTPYDLEVELVTLKGNILWTRTTGQTEIVDGKCVKISGVFQDIDEIKKSQLALDLAHKEMKAILNSSPIGIISTDENGIINHFNYGAEVMLGYSASEIIGIRGVNLFHDNEESEFFLNSFALEHDLDPQEFDFYTEIKKHDLFDTREWTYKRKDGTTFPVQLTISNIKNEKGEHVGLLGVSLDITERKKAKDELLRKNELLNFAEEITMIGHWQWDTVADKVQWSRNLYTMFELSENTIDLKFDSYFSFVHPEDKDIVTDYFQRSAENKDFESFTHRIITTTGKVKTVRLLGKVFVNEKGDVVEMIGTGQDITQLKMAENKFRGLLESAPDAMVIINQKGIIQLINKEAENLFGYSSLELLDASAEILFPKRFIAFFYKYLNLYYGNPKIKAVGVEKESFGKNKNGNEIPVQITLNSIETENGLLVTAAIRDIAIQKEVESTLLRKNQLLNFAEEITMMGNWQMDMITKEVIWSDNLYNIYELDTDESLTFDKFISFVHPDDLTIIHQHNERLNNNRVFDDLTHRIVLRSGAVKTILSLAEVIINDKGEIIEIIGTCQDITQQRMAENKFRGLLESAPDAMIIINEYGKIQLINKQAENLFGYSSLELLEKSADKLIPKRFYEDYEAYLDNYFGSPAYSAVGVEKELFGIDKEGKEIPIQISLSPLQTEEGLLVSAAIRDITVQKIAEYELLSKNQLLSFAEQITMMGNWQWDLITNRVKWSTSLYKIFEVEENKDIIMNTYLDFIHPEDKNLVNEKIQESLNGKLFNKVVHRIVLRNGTIKTIQLLAVITTTNGGDVTEMIGTCQDITQQRIDERKIIQANENLETLTQRLTGQNKQLAEFAHISSHNLRSPVSNLNALLHLYHTSENDDDKKEVFEKFEIVTNHLTSTLNTLIEALKTKKQDEKKLEKLSFEEVLNKTKEIISEKIINAKAIITNDFSEISQIDYHKTYLESIFLNLLTNAIKYRSSERLPEIHIKTESVEDKIILTFRDNGLGIDLKKHGLKLFGLNKTFHRHPDAKGVGLYLTKIQVNSMGGKISAKSKVGKGSVFTVIFNLNTYGKTL